MLGDPSVGKTTLLNCFAHKEFSFNTTMTIAVDYVFKDVHIGKDIIKAKIADTGTYISLHHASMDTLQSL